MERPISYLRMALETTLDTLRCSPPSWIVVSGLPDGDFTSIVVVASPTRGNADLSSVGSDDDVDYDFNDEDEQVRRDHYGMGIEGREGKNFIHASYCFV